MNCIVLWSCCKQTEKTKEQHKLKVLFLRKNKNKLTFTLWIVRYSELQWRFCQYSYYKGRQKNALQRPTVVWRTRRTLAESTPILKYSWVTSLSFIFPIRALLSNSCLFQTLTLLKYTRARNHYFVLLVFVSGFVMCWWTRGFRLETLK